MGGDWPPPGGLGREERHGAEDREIRGGGVTGEKEREVRIEGGRTQTF